MTLEFPKKLVGLQDGSSGIQTCDLLFSGLDPEGLVNELIGEKHLSGMACYVVPVLMCILWGYATKDIIFATCRTKASWIKAKKNPYWDSQPVATTVVGSMLVIRVAKARILTRGCEAVKISLHGGPSRNENLTIKGTV